MPDERFRQLLEAAPDAILQVDEEGRIIEDAPPAELFTDPKDERTRRFLRRIVDAGRL